MTLRKRRILLWSQHALMLTGLSALAYCLTVRIEAEHYQTWVHEELQESSSLADVPAPRHVHLCTDVTRLDLWVEWTSLAFAYPR